MRKITNAYEAFWFISQHPKFRVPERCEVPPDEAAHLEAEGTLISRDIGGKCYRYFRHSERQAIDHALDIHYAKVNKPRGGRVDDDKTKNKYIECWLEFGPEYYGYMSGGQYEWDDTTGLLSSHDTNLDCGGATFDEALIKLAKKILKHYGDYTLADWKKERSKECRMTVKLGKHGILKFTSGRGKALCADCVGHEAWRKKQGLKKKEATV